MDASTTAGIQARLIFATVNAQPRPRHTRTIAVLVAIASTPEAGSAAPTHNGLPKMTAKIRRPPTVATKTAKLNASLDCHRPPRAEISTAKQRGMNVAAVCG